MQRITPSRRYVRRRNHATHNLRVASKAKSGMLSDGIAGGMEAAHRLAETSQKNHIMLSEIAKNKKK